LENIKREKKNSYKCPVEVRDIIKEICTGEYKKGKEKFL
jgi:hypothetical protein